MSNNITIQNPNFELVKSANGKALFYDLKRQFFVAADTDLEFHKCILDQCFEGIEIKTELSYELPLRAVDIIPGNDCNLVCSYCYRTCDENRIERSMMQDAINFVRTSCSHDDLEFCFIGGEPLLYLDEIILSIDLILKKFPKARFVMLTNGTLITHSICRFFEENNFYVIVSIDGEKSRHNKARKLKNNSLGSFDCVNDGVVQLKDHSVKFAFCVTVGEHNIEWFANDVEWLLNQYEPNDIHVNGILHRKGGRGDEAQIEFALGLISLFEQFNSKIMPLPKQVQRWFLPFFRTGEKMHFDCAAFGRKVVISPCGYHVCEGYASKNKTVPLNKLHQLINHWRSYETNTNPFCANCNLRFICKGGCKYNAHQGAIDNARIDSLYCKTNRTLFDYISNKIFDDFKTRKTFYMIYDYNTLSSIWPSISEDHKSDNVNWS